MIHNDLYLERVAAMRGDLDTPEQTAFGQKNCAALAEDAAGFAAHAKESAASHATLFQAIVRLAGTNQIVRELAELGETLADDLTETAEDARVRYMLEGERYDTK